MERGGRENGDIDVEREGESKGGEGEVDRWRRKRKGGREIFFLN